MKAEERKEIETNSLVLAVQRWRKHASGRGLYYAIGTIALVIGGILLYRYFAGESKKARDAILLQLATADTPEKLKQGMEDHRGTIYGSLFKLHLARHHLKTEGLPNLGTDRSETRRQAAASVEFARTYYLELTGELKEKDEPSLVQEAWLGAAAAEEALVGLPTTEGGTEYRGNADKVIEYLEKGSAIFPDQEFSKHFKERAEKLKANKDKFVADQQAIYKQRELPPFSPSPGPAPGKSDPFGPGLPPIPGLPPSGSTSGPPTAPPMPPPPVKTEDPKSTDPKSAATKTNDPKTTDPKSAESPKGTEPKSK